MHRKKPNTKCRSIPHQVCELVTKILNVSAVAICFKTGEGLCMFQTAPWDLPPSDNEQVWKVAGYQVQVAVLKYIRSFIKTIFPGKSLVPTATSSLKTFAPRWVILSLHLCTHYNWPYTGDWHLMQPSASWDLRAGSKAALQLDLQGSLHQCKLLVICLSLLWLSQRILQVPEIRCRKVPSEKCTDVPVEKCQQVPEQKCTEVGIILFWVSFIAILYRLLSRSAGTSPRNIALRKWLVSSYDCRLLTSISFLQERVQKRICSKATKRVLPKAEAPKQALP